MKVSNYFPLVICLVTLLVPLPAWSQFLEPKPTGLEGGTGFDFSPTLSSDLLEVYWSSAASGDWDILSARRENVDEPWTNFQPVEIINTNRIEGSPHLSPDGLTLTFSSLLREGGFGGQDLWQTTRASPKDSWQEPVNMGPAINSAGNDDGATFSADGLEIIYDRGCAPPAFGGCGTNKLRRSTRSSLSDPWSEPEWMITSLGYELGSAVSPALSPDGLSLYFQKNGEYGKYDIFVSERATLDSPFGPSVNLGKPANSSGEDRSPYIAADGSLYYIHNWRTLGRAPAELWWAQAETIAGLPGDFNGDGILDVTDIDDLTAQSAGGLNPTSYDLNSDSLVDKGDILVWVKDLFNTWLGDANVDGQFDSSDLIVVLASGTFGQDTDSVWSKGDFNGDGRTDTSDLVVALADGGFGLGSPQPATATVPEPSSGILLVLGLIGLCRIRRSS